VDRADFTGGWARRYDAATTARVDDEGSRGRRGDGPPEDGGLGCRGFGPVTKKTRGTMTEDPSPAVTTRPMAAAAEDLARMPC